MGFEAWTGVGASHFASGATRDFETNATGETFETPLPGRNSTRRGERNAGRARPDSALATLASRSFASNLSKSHACPMIPHEPTPMSLRGFDILRRLGSGGVGEVFLARSPSGRLVAIKTVARARAETAEALAAFAHEASVCVRLRHSCIVEVRAFIVREQASRRLSSTMSPAWLWRACSGSVPSAACAFRDSAAWHIVERVFTALAFAHDFRDAGESYSDRPSRRVSVECSSWTGPAA